jgi:hypothetical protein
MPWNVFCINLDCHLENARIPIQVDIGTYQFRLNDGT